ncbi:MAG TPA: tyrosine-protein phosphatase [Trebonia sp.]|nr:tyrosine-protein phosphatase [Trebonia sp.]
MALNHPANLRDVGGLALTGGGVTQSAVLYRSDALYPADEVPLTLPDWPPAVVVDLRSDFEREHAGTFPWPAATRAHHVPLLGEAAPQLLDRPLGDLYRHALDASGRLIAEVAAIVAAAPGPTLVQCAAGKDRTGVVIAIILLATGVQPAQVVADYTATAASMPDVLARMAARLGWEMPPFDDLPPLLRDAPHDAIGAVIDVVASEPGGAAGWLARQGMSAADLDRLRAKLSAPPDEGLGDLEHRRG